MELHLVHKSARGKIAVIGKTFKLGPPDPFLAKVLIIDGFVLVSLFQHKVMLLVCSSLS